MKNFLLFAFCFLQFCEIAAAQQISEKNTDLLYSRALELYREGEFTRSLRYADRGLELAPEYHDIRILRVRNLWALKRFAPADEDLNHLLTNASEYPAVLPLAVQRLQRFSLPQQALEFLDDVTQVYPHNKSLKAQQALFLLKADKPKQARQLANQLINQNVSGSDRYILQMILNRTVTHEIGLNYQFLKFSKAYSREDWSIISAEYQHNFGRTAMIARTTFSDRAHQQGMLYELEGYPVLNDRLYSFINLGISNGVVFPSLKGSAAVFLNFAKVFEAEAGGRFLAYSNNTYFTGILGITAYSGKFYFNTRAFLGPEKEEQLNQNYQFNVRYYFQNSDNYLFLRLGNGISPDETALYPLVQEKPYLDAWYGNVGINKVIGIHHIFRIGGGFLKEELSPEKKGSQFIGTAGYRFRF